MKNLELRKLIFGFTGEVLVEGQDLDTIVLEVEKITSNLIKGKFFRHSFGTRVELEDYTIDDYLAIFAQYSLTYGWAGIYQEIFNQDPNIVLSRYNRDVVEKYKNIIQKQHAKFKIIRNPEQTYKNITTGLKNTKTVLNLHQKLILKLMPIEILESVLLEDASFPMKETAAIFFSRILREGSNVDVLKHIQDPNQLMRVIVYAFATNIHQFISADDPYPAVGQYTKHLKFKIPTSARKKIWNIINNFQIDYALNQMHKFRETWKVLLKHIKYTKDSKIQERFPVAYEIKSKLYNRDYETIQGKIDTYIRNGNLEEAFLLEMSNGGSLLRHLFFYMRYKKGMKLTKKYRSKTQKAIVVEKDAIKYLKSKEFDDFLKTQNKRLLWTLYTVMQKKFWTEEDRKERYTYRNYLVFYQEALPKIDKDLYKYILYKIKKHLVNTNLGDKKFYIDESCKNYPLILSGREDQVVNLTDKMLPKGSKIELKDLDDKIIRFGIAWRGSSTDLDLNTSFFKKETDDSPRHLYYRDPVLSDKQGNLIAVSSGDITTSNSQEFSVEFIDVDYNLAKKHYKKMINTVISFRGETFGNLECYWFMSVIDKKDRIMPRTKIKLDLSKMDYAVQLLSNTREAIGLSVNLKKGIVKVLNIPFYRTHQYTNIRDRELTKIIKFLDYGIDLYKALKIAIPEENIVLDKKQADVIISPNDKKGLHPVKNLDIIQSYII